MKGGDDEQVNQAPRQVDGGQQDGATDVSAQRSDVPPDLLGGHAGLRRRNVQHERYQRPRQRLFHPGGACRMPAHARGIGRPPCRQRQGGSEQQHDQGLAASAGQHSIVDLQRDERRDHQQQMNRRTGDECANDFGGRNPQAAENGLFFFQDSCDSLSRHAGSESTQLDSKAGRSGISLLILKVRFTGARAALYCDQRSPDRGIDWRSGTR